MICNEFNNGKNLEYKWTRPDGYWKMTRGFINGGKSLDLHLLAKHILEEKALMKEKKKEVPSKKKKKPYIKYKGDNYENLG